MPASSFAVITRSSTPFDRFAAVRLDGDVEAELSAVLAAGIILAVGNADLEVTDDFSLNGIALGTSTPQRIRPRSASSERNWFAAASSPRA